MDNIPHNPKALYKHMEKKGAFEIDQFPFKDWIPETEQMKREWESYKKNVIGDPDDCVLSGKFIDNRNNLIDHLKPFVNRRGARNKRFLHKDNEVRLLQLETIPGSAKLVFRNSELCVGTMVPVYINSRETVYKDIEGASKQLYKKAKKLF